VEGQLFISWDMGLEQRIQTDDEVHAVRWLLTTRAGQGVLEKMRSEKRRPRCNCTAAGVEMYVAKRGNHYYLSRMPGSGILHDPLCESATDDNYLTGTVAYAPEVIVEREDGSLVVGYGRKTMAEIPPLNVMGIDGLFDLLIEQSGLNRHVHQIGLQKVTWANAGERLLKASEMIFFSDTLTPLSRRLLIPAAFDKENAAGSLAEFEQRLRGTVKAMICAPVKDVRRSPYGCLLILKHLPNLRFWISRAVGSSAEAMSLGQFSMDSPFVGYALCFAEVRPGRNGGEFTVDALSVRATDVSFMPCFSPEAATLAGQLRMDGYSFVHPLRFDAPDNTALADYAFLDQAMTPIFVFSGCCRNDLQDAAKRTLVGLLERNRAEVRTVTFAPDRANIIGISQIVEDKHWGLNRSGRIELQT